MVLAMQIPEFWAEARREDTIGGRTRVLRRFGWSNESQVHAEHHAEQRVLEAFSELRSGSNVAHRERKLPYGGKGLPIREQVVARNGDDVITRNSYGARCLNEPDVLFADVDVAPRLAPLAERALSTIGCLIPIFGLLWAVRLFAIEDPGAAMLCIIAAFALAIGSSLLGHQMRRQPTSVAASHNRMRAQVGEFAANHPGSRFAIYETPAGLRLLALHRTFDATSQEVQSLFVELKTDPAYAQMCALQACFRARVSAKPWRMDMRRPPSHARVPDHNSPALAKWIARYEERALGFAACRFLDEIGDGPTVPRCLDVQRVHDELCRARSDLPIA